MQSLLRVPRLSVNGIARTQRKTQEHAQSAVLRKASCGYVPRHLLMRAQPEQQSPPKPVAKDEELPPWAKAEKERKLQAEQPLSGLPWPLCLLFSTFTAIAAVGSVFEYIDRNPIFGVLSPDNPLWAPILLFFAVTGFPTAGFLFLKGVNGFNEAAERQDKIDGFM